MKTEKKAQEKEDEIKLNIQMENQVGMTQIFKYVGINLSGLIQEFIVKEIIPFLFLLRNFI